MMLVSTKAMIAAATMSLAVFLPAVQGQCTLQCANGGSCLTDQISEKDICVCPLGFHGELCGSLHAEINDSCTICPDGSHTYNDDKLIPYLNTTCLEFELLALMETDPVYCSLARQTASWCECHGAEPTCSLCSDGTNPWNSDVLVPDSNGLSCSDFVFFAAIAPEGPSCAAVQATLGVYCGCPGACRICGDELLPNPGRIEAQTNGMSCGELEYLANYDNPEESCTDNQNAWAAICCSDEAGDTPTISPSTVSISPSTELSESPTSATDVERDTPTVSPTTISVSPSTELSENPTYPTDEELDTPTFFPSTISISPSTEFSANPTSATDVEGATPTISPTAFSVFPSSELSENPTSAATATRSSSMHLGVVISGMVVIGAVVLLM